MISWRQPNFAALSSTLVINGTSKTPTWRYFGKDASGSGWVANIGTDLGFVEVGTDPTYGVAPPFGDQYTGMKINLADHYQAAAAGYSDIGTDDVVAELVVRAGPSSTDFRHIASKFVAIDQPCWAIWQDGQNRIVFFISDTDLVTVHGGALSASALYHLMLFADRSGSAVWYKNGVPQTAVDISSAAATADSTAKLTLGAGPLGTNQTTMTIYSATLWQGAGWLNSHLQPALVRERFHALTGGNSTLNVIS